MAEWLKAHAWKVCLRETVTRVRIPLSPPKSPPNHLKSPHDLRMAAVFPTSAGGTSCSMNAQVRIAGICREWPIETKFKPAAI